MNLCRAFHVKKRVQMLPFQTLFFCSLSYRSFYAATHPSSPWCDQAYFCDHFHPRRNALTRRPTSTLSSRRRLPDVVIVVVTRHRRRCARRRRRSRRVCVERYTSLLCRTLCFLVILHSNNVQFSSPLQGLLLNGVWVVLCALRRAVENVARRGGTFCLFLCRRVRVISNSSFMFTSPSKTTSTPSPRPPSSLSQP